MINLKKSALENYSIDLKNYSQVFTCELPVNLLAEKLLATWVTDKNLSDADLQHYIRLTEAIVNGVQNNASKCADIFNVIEGWVKLPVPGEKKKKINSVKDKW
jgi:hypothetical protein